MPRKPRRQFHVLFDQNKWIFEPHVLGILNGSAITLKSSDPVNHNINAKLKQQAFNQLLAPQGKSAFTPSGPERTPAEVTCDIHPWMKAWWMVFDHPYFAVTDAKGYFEIKKVAGRHPEDGGLARGRGQERIPQRRPPETRW